MTRRSIFQSVAELLFVAKAVQPQVPAVSCDKPLGEIVRRTPSRMSLLLDKYPKTNHEAWKAFVKEPVPRMDEIGRKQFVIDFEAAAGRPPILF